MITPELIEAMMDGVEFQDSDDADIRIDFAVAHEGQTIILYEGWWQRNWGLGNGLVVVQSEPEEEVVNGRWPFEGIPMLALAPSSDDESGLASLAARRRIDLDRSAYLAQLRVLQDLEPRFDLIPWTAAIMDRPEIDPFAELEGQTQTREVGRILLTDPVGAVTDALVVDEYGSVAVIQDDGFLSHFAEEWAGYSADDRPPLAEFMKGLGSKNFYGSVIARAGVISADGNVEAIAFQVAADTV